MPKFYINKNQQPSGDYEVHQENICDHAPNIENRIPLGTFNHCNDALQEAKRRFPLIIVMMLCKKQKEDFLLKHI